MNDIAFSVVIKNDGISDIIFKTIMLKGSDGNSIASIEKTSTVGLVDTYTITLTDGTIGGTFTVTNGMLSGFDDHLDDASTNAVQNKVVKASIDGLDSRLDALEAVTIDTALSSTSENTVQNKAIKNAIDALTGEDIAFDNTGTGLASTDVQNAIVDTKALIPAVDINLNTASENPIANSAVATKTASIDESIAITNANLARESSRIDNHDIKDIVLKDIIVVNLGNELLTNDASSIPTGWSGDNANGYTHTSGNEGALVFSLSGLVEIGNDYICEFDTNYTADEFMTIGLGDSYKILVYNGTNHILVPLSAIDGVDLTIVPYKNRTFTISNLSLKKIQSEGTEKSIAIGTVFVNSNASNYGFWNVIMGEGALSKAVGSSRCIAIGYYSLAQLQGGHRNIGIGTYSMSQMEGGEMNISIGADSMFTVKRADGCIAIGKGAMHSGTYLKKNIAIGDGSLNGGNDSTSQLNIAIGVSAGYACKGERNIFMGYNNAMGVSSGIANIYIGDQCEGVNNKNQNIVIGASAKAISNANRSIAIGYQAQTSKANQMVLGGTNITEVVLCGNKKINFNVDGTVTWEELT